VALKVIKKSKVKGDKEFEELMMQEIQTLEMLDHPHIVRVHEILEDDKNIYMALELIEHGNLLEVLSQMQENGTPFNERDVANIIYQILLAINYIHTSGVVHRDLKLENIMIDIEESLDGQTNVICKVTDFGFACLLDPRRARSLSIGTPLYMAPDVLNKMYDNKADIWSLGVIAYILLTGKPPFDGKDDDELFKQIRYGILDLEGLNKYHEEGEDAKDFIKKCLNRNAKARWTA